MATGIHGRRGRLYVGIASDTVAATEVANLKQWSIDFVTDKVDVTVFGDTNKVKVAGLPDCTGSFSGYYDTASAQLHTAAVDGLARKFYLYPTMSAATTYYYGTATFDFSITGSVDSSVDISGSFDAASAVTKVG